MKSIFRLICAFVLMCPAAGLSAQEPASDADSARTFTEPGAPKPKPGIQPAETAERLWDTANTAYINAEYHEAIRNYEALIDRDLVSDKLYYNLANAYFKIGRTGKAILYYNKALRLNPGDGDIRHNLDVASAMTKDKIASVPEFFLKEWLRSIRYAMGCTAWSVASLAALAAMLAFVLLYLLSHRIAWRKIGFYGTCALLLIFIGTTSFALSQRRSMLDRSEAVVMTSAASVKSSPEQSATDLFVLHEGTKVRITETLNDWREITIADGKKGWIRSDAIETI